ncbi:hypothetical protein SNE40_017644 [Patella caerulea]|uniref:DDE Tnp4 domain-containing protein n=1 Tax=Patella caerulea TaxID=87958 RepID=A0AAN8JFD5_PATCE
MAEPKEILTAMIPVVMDFLDIDLDDVLFSDVLSDSQIGDVVSAVVMNHYQNKVQSRAESNDKTSDEDDKNESSDDTIRVDSDPCVALPSSLPNGWSVLPPESFRAIYRISSPVFEQFLKLFIDKLIPLAIPMKVTTGKNDIRDELKLLIMLEYLGSNLPISKLSQKYNLSESGILDAVTIAISVIYQNMFLFIRWPKREDICDSALCNPLEQPGFSNCIGAIDICQVRIKTPQDNESFYVNKTGKSSVALQAVCDHKMNFLHCCTGWPGLMADTAVLKDSDIFEDVQKDTKRYFPNGTFLTGDLAYPLLDWIMTPYEETPDDSYVKYNHVHSQILDLINQTFQRLKTRFLRLNYVENNKMEEVVKIVLVCCALHNFCQNAGDIMEGEATPIEPHVSIDTFVTEAECLLRVEESAVIKRDEIKDIINSSDSIQVVHTEDDVS